MWAFLRHFFTPHHSNNHRPKALHPQALLFYILFFLFLQFNLSNLKAVAPNILGFATDINAEKLVTLTNQKRAEQGLASLNLDSQLSQAAAGKAQDMFTKDYWAHNSPDGQTPWVFIKNAGYGYLYAGENLAKNFSNSEGVVEAWMASPSHRTNVLKAEYQDVGFAVVNGRLNGEETTLVVEMFGTRSKAEVAVQSPVLPPATAVPTTLPPSKPTLFPTPVPKAEVAATGEKAATLAARLGSSPALFTSAKNSPVFNHFSLTKNFVLVLALFLMFILSLDAFLVWRRKTVRLAGHNLAHFFFLITVMAAASLTYQGAIR